MTDSILQVNQIKDKGGNATGITVADSTANVTINNLTATTLTATTASIPAAAGSSMVLLEKFTASNTAEKIFNLDSYSSYNTHTFIMDHLLPATDNVTLQAHLGTSSSSFASTTHDYSFGTMFQYHRYSDGDNGRTSEVTHTRAYFLPYVGNDSGSGVCGIFNVFGATNSSQRTFLNHRVSMWQVNNYSQHHTGGSIKTTATDDAYIRFQFNSGNIASGTIALYGVKDA